MNFLTNLNTVNFRLIISELQEAEIARDFEKMKRSFSSFWLAFSDAPEIPTFLELKSQAELTRIAGAFLISV